MIDHFITFKHQKLLLMDFKYGIDTLTCSQVIEIARNQRQGIFSKEAQEQVAKCYQHVLEISHGTETVYGVNTGFGPLCNTKISKEQTSILQKKLLLSHSVGVGQPIDKELSKIMLILKVHALSKGFSGIAPYVIDRIMWHIENDVIPVVPEQGSVGASGDLAPLSHLFIPLLGEGEVHHNGSIKPTKEVLESFNLNPLELHPKAGLALINGTQFIAAHAIRIIEKFHNCLAHADLIGSMMIDGLQGSITPFQDDLHETRPYHSNKHVAFCIKGLLNSSEILKDHEFCDRVQDPYSLRCIPQVHGTSRTAWNHLKDILEIEINSVTDNPIVFSKDRAISGGNFHGQPLALPIDYVCLAAAELGNISDRRSYFSLEGKVNRVPKLLLKDTGVDSGFMIVQYTSAALASENKSLCFPASADSIPTSLGQEDHVSMGSISGRKTLRVIENLEKILAVELLCAAQALDFHRPLQSSAAIDAMHEAVRQVIPFAEEDRIFAKDIQAALKLIQSKQLLAINPVQSIRQSSPFYEQFETY